jgi:hypothetical protein
MKKLQMNWQRTAIGLLGAWLVASAWVLSLQLDVWVIAANVLLGLALVSSAILSVVRPQAAEDWLAASVGAVITVMPSLMGFSEDFVASANAQSVGLATLVLAMWLCVRNGEFGPWDWDDGLAR